MLAYAFDSLWGTAIALLVFFAAFNLLEATLPSLISKIAPVGAKGTAIGVYSSVQFLGTFVAQAWAATCLSIMAVQHCLHFAGRFSRSG